MSSKPIKPFCVEDLHHIGKGDVGGTWLTAAEWQRLRVTVIEREAWKNRYTHSCNTTLFLENIIQEALTWLRYDWAEEALDTLQSSQRERIKIPKLAKYTDSQKKKLKGKK